jgi:hypothetical protein
MKRFIRETPSRDKDIIEIDGKKITQYRIRYGQETKRTVSIADKAINFEILEKIGYKEDIGREGKSLRR